MTAGDRDTRMVQTNEQNDKNRQDSDNYGRNMMTTPNGGKMFIENDDGKKATDNGERQAGVAG